MNNGEIDIQHARLVRNLSHQFGAEIMTALNDPDVTEVILNDDGQLWIEALGKGMRKGGKVSAAQAYTILSLMASSLKIECRHDLPIVEGELPIDGSRFEGMIPPVVSAPSFCIRKKATRIFTLEEYLAAGIIDGPVAKMLRDAITAHENILVVGGTGSGKTTLVNAIIHEMSVLCPYDRLVIIEDTAELQSSSDNTLFLRADVHTSIQQLVKATMRLRPDRILIGEVRDGAALDLLKAWNTGHPGGVATVHANGALHGLLRIGQLIAEAIPTPMETLIGEAVHLVVFITKTRTHRTVAEVARVHGFSFPENKYIMEYLHGQQA